MCSSVCSGRASWQRLPAKVLLRLLYASGGRVSEIAALKWRDLVARDAGGQVTLFGKGGKTSSNP
jgi:site-specific recombinase XerD